MTTIEITIQNRNNVPTITWLETKGDDLPQELLTEINLALARVLDKNRL